MILFLVKSKSISTEDLNDTKTIQPPNNSSLQIKDEKVFKIKKKNFVVNKTGKQCIWSCIETIGRNYNVKKIISPPLTTREECQKGGDSNQISKLLDKIKVQYKISENNSFKYIYENTPIIVGMNNLSVVPGEERIGHAVIVDSIYNDSVFIIDTSSYRIISELSIDEFKNQWDGWSCKIYQ